MGRTVAGFAFFGIGAIAAIWAISGGAPIAMWLPPAALAILALLVGLGSAAADKSDQDIGSNFESDETKVDEFPREKFEGGGEI